MRRKQQIESYNKVKKKYPTPNLIGKKFFIHIIFYFDFLVYCVILNIIFSMHYILT